MIVHQLDRTTWAARLSGRPVALLLRCTWSPGSGPAYRFYDPGGRPLATLGRSEARLAVPLLTAALSGGLALECDRWAV